MTSWHPFAVPPEQVSSWPAFEVGAEVAAQAAGPALRNIGRPDWRGKPCLVVVREIVWRVQSMCDLSRYR